MQLSTGASLPGSRSAPHCPTQPGEWLGKASKVPSACPQAPLCAWSLVQGELWFLFLFFSPKALLPICHLWVFLTRWYSGLRVEVTDPCSNRSLGDRQAVQGGTPALSGCQGVLECYNSMEGIWQYPCTLRQKGPPSLSPSGIPAYRNTQVQSCECKGFTAAESKSAQRPTIREVFE